MVGGAKLTGAKKLMMEEMIGGVLVRVGTHMPRIVLG